MTPNLEKLQIDIGVLKTSINHLEIKLKETNLDPLLVPKIIESKDQAEALLSQKQNALSTENESLKLKAFGGIRMNANQIAGLSIGGSLRTSSLDKTSLNDDAKKKLIEDVSKAEADEAIRAAKLLEVGLIVQRKMN